MAKQANRLTIIGATDAHLPIVRDIAYQTWPDTFGAILSPVQIDYMLNMMYSLDALRIQIHERKHVFLLATEPDETTHLGYVSYEIDYQGQPTTKLHKLYVLPGNQGKGIEYALVNAVANVAHQHANDRLSLNVNRFNKAIGFYERLGFVSVGAEDIDIGNGFLMQDIILEKRVGNDSPSRL